MSDFGTPPPQDPNQPAYGAQPPYGQPAAGQPAAGQPTGGYTAWPQRVLSYLIDFALLIPAYIVYFIGVAIGDAFGMLIALVGLVGMIGIVVWNSGFKQGTTGQSIGKGVIGTRLISEETGQPIGFGMAFVRQLAHILDGICFIGYLWPLWDEKRQTFADKIIKTVVVDVPK